MSNTKISALPISLPLSAQDIFIVNQEGTTKQVSLSGMVESIVDISINNNNTETKLIVLSGIDFDKLECDSTLVWDCTAKKFTVTTKPKFDAPPAKSSIKFLGRAKSAYSFVMGVTLNEKVVYWGNDVATIGGRNIAVAPQNYVRMKFVNDYLESTTHEDYLVLNSNVKIVDLQYSKGGAMALLSDGSVWLNGWYGPSTGGNLLNYLRIKSSDELYAANSWMQGYFLRANIPSNVKIVKISYGAIHNWSKDVAIAYNFMCLTDTKDVYVFGQNRYGSCGVNVAHATLVKPTKITDTKIATKVKDIFAGWSYIATNLILLENGELYGAGYNGYGQLGTGNTLDNTKFVLIDTNVASIADNNMFLTKTNVLYIKNDGSIWGTGDGNCNQLGIDKTDASKPRQITKTGTGGFFKKIVTSGYEAISVMAMDINGNVYTWGYNAHGALGDGTNVNRGVPYKIPNIIAEDIYGSEHVGTANCFIIKAKNNMLYASGYRAYTNSFPSANTDRQNIFYPYNIHIINDRIRDINMFGFVNHYGTFLTSTEGQIYYNGYAPNSQGSIIGDTITEFSLVL
jgi:hypothetical protein